MCTPYLKDFLRIILLISWTLSLGGCRFSQLGPSVKEIQTLLPYHINFDSSAPPPKEALDAEVLLLGGKEAIPLGLELQKQFAQNEKISFYSFTAPGLNLARIFNLFANNQFKAKIIMFYPSIDDEREHLFHVLDTPIILENLKRIDSWWWKPLYSLLPNVALSLLKKISTQIQLESDPSISTEKLSDLEKINRSLTSSALFKFTIEHWVESLPKKNFIFITTPFDPNLAPTNCKLTLKWPSKNIFKEQMLSLNSEDWAKALEVNDELKQVAPFNATTYFLRAKIFKKLNDAQNTYRFLNLAAMLNCQSPYLAWKNIILDYEATKKSQKITLYNLSKIVIDECFEENKECFSNGELQLDFYQNSAEALAILIKNYSL